MKIDINKADINELTKINGIGLVLAKEIIKIRQDHPFCKPGDLLKVKGIGKRLLKKIKKNIVINKGVDIVFNPVDYGLGEVGEVHLVGDMNDWDPADLTYSLEEQEDGSWIGNFNLQKGTEYKFIYDSLSWDDGRDIGDHSGGNLVI